MTALLKIHTMEKQDARSNGDLGVLFLGLMPKILHKTGYMQLPYTLGMAVSWYPRVMQVLTLNGDSCLPSP